MKQFNKIFLTFLFVFAASLSLVAQNKFFRNASESDLSKSNGKRTIIPQKFRAVTADIDQLKAFLWSLPAEKNVFNRNNAPVMELPMPDGSSARFRVWESSIQEPALEAKFPEIRTFLGQGIDDRYATIRFDFTDFGFHAAIISVNGNIYMDPYARGDVNNYISYYTIDNNRNPGFVCQVKENQVAGRAADVLAAGPCRGTQLYTYRLAVGCTHQYAIAVGGTTAALLHSAIVTTVNRVVGVYENEIAVRMILVATNNLIEFRTAATDPYTGNDDAGTLIDESQTIITNAIGSANFDIGHTFSTGGGGLAGLGVVCRNTQKASGITGLPNPVGDDYDIDFVAHEMGHQFGGSHTFNSSAGNCGGGNRSGATAYEVGSGTTIMGYAGICSNDDIQLHSDPFFHTVSFDQISNYMEGSGASCRVLSATGNTLPQITAMNNNSVSIPVNTPFTLTGAATDADGDALTYCWEEWDLGPTSTWAAGASTTTEPIFKSRIPKTSGSRTFPDPAYIAANYLPVTPPATMGGLKGEKLPTVARTMKFRLTVRDNRAGGGGVVTGGNGCQTDYSGVFSVSTILTSGPFAVTAPNGGESYAGGSTQTITWNVVGTDVAPFNVSNVKISLSTDGGLTFPTVISASTANDGSEALVIPSIASTTARVKVEAIDNIFFDISNANFTITAAASGFTFNSIAPAIVPCGSATATATIATATQGSFSTPIVLSASGNPAGTTVSIATSPLTPGNSTTVTLNNVNTLAPGTYNVTITGVAGAITQTGIIAFTVQPGTPPAITSAPAAATICAGANATFNVAAAGTGLSYQWQVSTGSGPFADISGATGTSYTVTGATAAQNGNAYQVIVSTNCGSSTSAPAVLTVNAATAISAQPSDATICAGNNNTFTVNATGTGLSYQWQQSTTGCGGSFTNIAGATSASYTLSGITLGQNGYAFRVIVTGTCAPATVTSGCATLSVSGSVGITAQPVNAIVCNGSDASFAIVASGSGVNYQWQVSTGGPFTNIAGATNATLTLPAVTAAANGNQYQVVLTNPTCSTPSTSAIVTLTVNELPTITTQPASATICAGSNTTFTAAATGTGISYQWQVSTGSGPFADIAGATSASFAVNAATAGMNNNQYHVVVSGVCSPAAVSSAATLTVISPAGIATQPSLSAACENSDANITVTATSGGAPAVIYQWQVSNGGPFTNITGATNATLTLQSITPALSGNQYQVVVSNATCPATTVSVPVTLTVNALPVISAQTNTTSVCTGTPAMLTASGAGSTGTYTWTPGNLNGDAVTVNPSVDPSAPGQVNTIVYTVTGTDANGCESSSSVTIDANPLPVVTLTADPANTSLEAGQTVLLKASVIPTGSFVYTWKKDDVVILNTTDSLRVTANDAGSYTVTAGNASGDCANTSNAIAISDSVTNKFYIFPNPNNGQFFISYHKPTSIPTARNVTVYDNKGAKVYTKALAIDQPYQLIKVDLGAASKGLYIVVLYDGTGHRLATGKVFVQN